MLADLRFFTRAVRETSKRQLGFLRADFVSRLEDGASIVNASDAGEIAYLFGGVGARAGTIMEDLHPQGAASEVSSSFRQSTASRGQSGRRRGRGAAARQAEEKTAGKTSGGSLSFSMEDPDAESVARLKRRGEALFRAGKPPPLHVLDYLPEGTWFDDQEYARQMQSECWFNARKRRRWGGVDTEMSITSSENAPVEEISRLEKQTTNLEAERGTPPLAQEDPSNPPEDRRVSTNTISNGTRTTRAATSSISHSAMLRSVNAFCRAQAEDLTPQTALKLTSLFLNDGSLDVSDFDYLGLALLNRVGDLTGADLLQWAELAAQVLDDTDQQTFLSNSLERVLSKHPRMLQKMHHSDVFKLAELVSTMFHSQTLFDRVVGLVESRKIVYEIEDCFRIMRFLGQTKVERPHVMTLMTGDFEQRIRLDKCSTSEVQLGSDLIHIAECFAGVSSLFLPPPSDLIHIAECFAGVGWVDEWFLVKVWDALEAHFVALKESQPALMRSRFAYPVLHRILAAAAHLSTSSSISLLHRLEDFMIVKPRILLGVPFKHRVAALRGFATAHVHLHPCLLDLLTKREINAAEIMEFERLMDEQPVVDEEQKPKLIRKVLLQKREEERAAKRASELWQERQGDWLVQGGGGGTEVFKANRDHGREAALRWKRRTPDEVRGPQMDLLLTGWERIEEQTPAVTTSSFVELANVLTPENLCQETVRRFFDRARKTVLEAEVTSSAQVSADADDVVDGADGAPESLSGRRPGAAPPGADTRELGNLLQFIVMNRAVVMGARVVDDQVVPPVADSTPRIENRALDVEDAYHQSDQQLFLEGNAPSQASPRIKSCLVPRLRRPPAQQHSLGRSLAPLWEERRATFYQTLWCATIKLATAFHGSNDLPYKEMLEIQDQVLASSLLLSTHYPADAAPIGESSSARTRGARPVAPREEGAGALNGLSCQHGRKAGANRRRVVYIDDGGDQEGLDVVEDGRGRRNTRPRKLVFRDLDAEEVAKTPQSSPSTPVSAGVDHHDHNRDSQNSTSAAENLLENPGVISDAPHITTEEQSALEPVLPAFLCADDLLCPSLRHPTTHVLSASPLVYLRALHSFVNESTFTQHEIPKEHQDEHHFKREVFSVLEDIGARPRYKVPVPIFPRTIVV